MNESGEIDRTGFDASPYTQEPLGIDYPKSGSNKLVLAAKKAGQSCSKICTKERV